MLCTTILSAISGFQKILSELVDFTNAHSWLYIGLQPCDTPPWLFEALVLINPSTVDFSSSIRLEKPASIWNIDCYFYKLMNTNHEEQKHNVIYSMCLKRRFDRTDTSWRIVCWHTMNRWISRSGIYTQQVQNTKMNWELTKLSGSYQKIRIWRTEEFVDSIRFSSGDFTMRLLLHFFNDVLMRRNAEEEVTGILSLVLDFNHFVFEVVTIGRIQNAVPRLIHVHDCSDAESSDWSPDFGTHIFWCFVVVWTSELAHRLSKIMKTTRSYQIQCSMLDSCLISLHTWLRFWRWIWRRTL